MSKHCITTQEHRTNGKAEANASQACDWLDGGLTFARMLHSLMTPRLERKFQVKISIESERLKGRTLLRFFFDSNQNIYDVSHEINVEKQYTWKVEW